MPAASLSLFPVLLACMPALAKLVVIYLGQFTSWIQWDQLPPPVAESLQDLQLHLNVLAGGFILTSLIWASAMARIIDRRFAGAAVYMAIGGVLVLFGVMHSPLAGDRMFLPWHIWDAEAGFDDHSRRVVLQFAVAYMLMAILLFVLDIMMKNRLDPIDSDEAFEQLVH